MQTHTLIHIALYNSYKAYIINQSEIFVNKLFRQANACTYFAYLVLNYLTFKLASKLCRTHALFLLIIRVCVRNARRGFPAASRRSHFAHVVLNNSWFKTRGIILCMVYRKVYGLAGKRLHVFRVLGTKLSNF